MSNIVKCWWSSREKGSPCFNMVDSECPACQCEMHIRDDLCCGNGNDDDVYKLSRWSVVALLKQTVMFLRLCDSNHYYNCTVVLWSAELQPTTFYEELPDISTRRIGVAAPLILHYKACIWAFVSINDVVHFVLIT